MTTLLLDLHITTRSSAMSQKALDQWDCNEGTLVRPDGLPPGWCIQTAEDGVSMWMGKRDIIIKYKSIHPGEHLFKRVTVERLLGNGKIDTYTFIVEEKRDHAVTWLAGTDTGSIRITKVEPAPTQGPLEAVAKLKIVRDAHFEIMENHGPAPVYANVSIFKPGTNTPNYAGLVIGNGQTRKFYSADPQLTYKWRGAEWIRTNLYAPWPPT